MEQFPQQDKDKELADKIPFDVEDNRGSDRLPFDVDAFVGAIDDLKGKRYDDLPDNLGQHFKPYTAESDALQSALENAKRVKIQINHFNRMIHNDVLTRTRVKLAVEQEDGKIGSATFSFDEDGKLVSGSHFTFNNLNTKVNLEDNTTLDIEN